MNYEGGGTTSATASGGKLEKPADPTPEGYTFGGWYKEAACTNEWNFDTDTVTTDGLTLYAKWTEDTYTVTLNRDDGTGTTTTLTVTDGKLVGLTDPPERQGYKFMGWYTEPNGGGKKVTDGMSISELIPSKTRAAIELNLFAYWKAVYTVTFNTDGGTAVESVTVTSGETITKPADPTRTGYTFGGWYKDAECGTAWNFETDTVTTDSLTLYAKWTETVYTVKFYSQDNMVASSYPNYGKPISIPDNPTRDGYDFAGWFTAPQTDNTAQEWDFATGVTGDMDLYAHWTPVSPTEYTITFNANGGTVDPATATTSSGKLASLPTPTRTDGCAFLGWYTAEKGGSAVTSDTVFTENATIYARWEYTVTFVFYGGTLQENNGITVSNPVTCKTDASGKVVGWPDTPKVTGYYSHGWFDEIDVQYTQSETIESNMTLHIKWGINMYTVTFNTQGGTSVSSQIVEHGGVATEPTVPTMESNTFKRWTLKGAPYDFSTPVTENIELVAEWNEPIVSPDGPTESTTTYTVTFNSQGGSNIDSVIVKSGDKVAIPNPAPTRNDYTFAGWYTSTDDSGNASGEVWDFDTLVTGNITLYAKWEANVSSAAFDADPGNDGTNEGTEDPSPEAAASADAPQLAPTAPPVTEGGASDDETQSGDVILDTHKEEDAILPDPAPGTPQSGDDPGQEDGTESGTDSAAGTPDTDTEPAPTEVAG